MLFLQQHVLHIWNATCCQQGTKDKTWVDITFKSHFQVIVIYLKLAVISSDRSALDSWIFINPLVFLMQRKSYRKQLEWFRLKEQTSWTIWKTIFNLIWVYRDLSKIRISTPFRNVCSSKWFWCFKWPNAQLLWLLRPRTPMNSLSSSPLLHYYVFSFSLSERLWDIDIFDHLFQWNMRKTSI